MHKTSKGKEFMLPESVNNDFEGRNIPELKLNLAGPRDNTFLTGMSPGLKENILSEPWCELKVRDKFIEKRSQHMSCIYHSKHFVYGGNDLNLGIFSDFYYIDIKEDFSVSHWKPVDVHGKTHPGPISRAPSVLIDSKWYIFGGQINTCENSNKLWCFDFAKMAWSLVKPKTGSLPPCMDSHSMCHYKEDGVDYLVVFGGFIGEEIGEYWNQVCKYDLTNGRWILPYKDDKMLLISPSGPTVRGAHGAVIRDNFMYVFGGTDGEARFNDTWKYDLRKNTWTLLKTANPPATRNGHSMSDYKQKGFIVFGGIQDITHERDDTMFFNYSTEEWTRLDPDKSTTSLVKFNSELVENPESPPTGSRKGNRRRTTFKANPRKNFSPPFRAQTKSITDSSPTRTFSPPGKEFFDPKDSILNPNTKSHLNSISDNHRVSPTKSALAQNSIEKKRKAFLQQKSLLLKEFEVVDPTLRSELMLKSPTTEAMKNSITALTYKRNVEPQQAPSDSPLKTADSPMRRAKKVMYNTYSGPFAGESITKYKIPQDGKLIGQKPCARDGHTAICFKDKMIVFGGDRHKMSFNDIYLLSLDIVFNQKD